LLTGIVLLVIGVIGMIIGVWLLFWKRRRLSGSLLLVAGAVVFLVSLSWPADLIFEGDPAEMGDPPTPQRVPVYEEGS
jgi:hypothetical protein